MVPKIIHYCWFGRNPLPESAVKCIESWKKFFPEYEIREWNEDNFDVNVIPYTEEAYSAGKYAFVSDYARFWILYNFGGLYFDTDVEIINPMDDIVAGGAFMGAEVDGNSDKNKFPKVAPGLCIGALKGMKLFKLILDKYSNLDFWGSDGTFNKYTMIPLVTDLLISEGLKADNDIQNVGGLTVYPSEYFNPLEISTGRLKITPNTRSIHWFMASWLPSQPLWKKKLKQYARRLIKIFK